MQRTASNSSLSPEREAYIQRRINERSEARAEELLGLRKQTSRRPGSRGSPSNRRRQSSRRQEGGRARPKELSNEDNQIRGWAEPPPSNAEVAWGGLEEIDPLRGDIWQSEKDFETIDAENERRHRAATRIQSRQRVAADRNSFLEKRQAATKIQGYQKTRSARQEFLDKREAAIKIQSVQRRKAALDKQARNRGAATRVQAMQRGRRVREELQEKREAITKIQAAHRGSRVRQEMYQERRRDSATRIQALARGRADRQQRQREIEAAVTLQAMQRSHAVRKYLRTEQLNQSTDRRRYKPKQIALVRDLGLQTDSRPPSTGSDGPDALLQVSDSTEPGESLQMSDVWRMHRAGISRVFKAYASKVGQNRTGFNSTFDKVQATANSIDKTTFFQLCNDFNLFISKNRKVDMNGERIKPRAERWYRLWSSLVEETEFPEYCERNGEEIARMNRAEGSGFEKSMFSQIPVAHMLDAPSDSNSAPIVEDDGVIPLERDEVLAIFQACSGEEGNYSRLNLKAFARALFKVAQKGVHRLWPSPTYIRQTSREHPEPKAAFRNVAVPSLRRLKFRTSVVPKEAAGAAPGEFTKYAMREWYAAIPIQTIARGFLQRRRYRCGTCAYTAVSEIIAVKKMIMLSPAQCFLALLTRMRLANPGALRRKLMETTKGFVFDANAGASKVEWKRSMIKADENFDSKVAQDRIMSTMVPPKKKPFSDVKPKVDSNRPKRSSPRVHASAAEERKRFGSLDVDEDVLSNFDNISSISSLNMMGSSTAPASVGGNVRVISSSVFPTSTSVEDEGFQNYKNSVLHDGKQFTTSQFSSSPRENWLDDLGVKGDDPAKFQPYETFKKKNVGLRKSLTAPGKSMTHKRISRRDYVNGLPPERKKRSALPRVARIVHEKYIDASMTPLSWESISNNDGFSKPISPRYSPITTSSAVPMPWKEMTTAAVDDLLSADSFQPGRALAPRPPPPAQPFYKKRSEVKFAETKRRRPLNRKASNAGPSPLKATRVLTSRQVTNRTKYHNH
jgi:hypothetical protein